MSTTALSKVENGKQSLTFAQACAVAKALSLTVNDLENLSMRAEAAVTLSMRVKDMQKTLIQKEIV